MSIHSFDILRNALACPPILIHPNYEKTFILSSDSSDTALGAMIGQRDNYGIIHPIAYFSEKSITVQIYNNRKKIDGHC